MRGRPDLALDNFLGGLNLRDSPWDIANNESSDVADFRPLGTGGAIQRRQGDLVSGSDWGPASNGEAGMFSSRDLGDVLIPTADGSLTNQAGASLAGPPAGGLNGHYAFVQAPANGGQGPIYYIAPGTPRVVGSWDGTAIGTWTTTAGTVPLAHYLTYAGNRVWAARTDTDPDAVYWSEIGEPRNWPVANVVKFGVGDGEVITGIDTAGSNVIVFKETRAWLIYDLDTGANRPLGPYGNAGVRTLDTPYGLAFLDSKRGICVTDGSRVDRIGDTLGEPIQVTTYDLAFADDSLFVAATMLGFAGQYEGLFEYDFRTKSWWLHTLPASRGLAELDGSLYATRSNARRLYTMLGGASNGYDGNPLTPRWTSRFFTLGDSQVAKRIKSVEIAGEGSLTVTGRRNHLAATAFTRGPYSLPIANVSNRLRIPDLGMAYALQIQIAGASGDIVTDVARLDELVIRIVGRRD